MTETTIKKEFVYGPLIIFSIIIFLISFGDAIMAYVTPVFIQNNLKDPMLVGLILSMSSLFGMFFDVFLGEKLGFKTYKFFIMAAILVAFLFPVTLLVLPSSIATFIIAMAIWSAYYELRNYSKFNFIHRFTSKEHHATAFSITAVFQDIAYTLGPLIAVLLLDRKGVPFYVTILILGIAGLIYLGFFQKDKVLEPITQREKSLLKEIKLLKILLKRIWPLLIFSFSLTMIDVSFWTTGVLYAENLRNKYELGGLFMVFYGIPSLFVGLIVPRIHKKLGKKKTAFVLATLAGLGLLCLGLNSNIYAILGLVFIASALYSISNILITAVYEDYVARLREEGNDLVSANQISINAAYFVGPIILGVISKYINYEATFIVVGANLMLMSVMALLVVPRKVKMPQQELATELAKKE